MSWLKQIRTDEVKSTLICLNINARTKFWTKLLLVSKSKFTPTTQAKMWLIDKWTYWQHSKAQFVKQIVDIKAKCRNELQSKKAMFQQVNGRPHVSEFTSWFLYGLKWNHLQYPLYSPDIVSSIFYIFSYLQLHLEGIINSAQDIQKEVDPFLDLQLPSFWEKGFEKLRKSWQKIIDLGDDYYHIKDIAFMLFFFF